MTSRPHSLQRRLLVGVVGLVAAVWLGMAVLTWFDVRHELDELLDSHLAQAAALLVAQQLPEVEEEAGGIDAPILHRYAPRVSFQVWHEGRLVLRSANAPSEPLGRPGHGFESGFRTRRIGGIVWRVFATRGAVHDVQVYVGEQAASRASILMAVLRSVLWPMALALPLLALVGWWGVRRGLAPLQQMGHALAARDPRAVQPVQLPDAPVEMSPMLDALNELFRRIGALMDSERRFTADAAHELRTPIAAIRAQAQVALGESDPALRRHALQATLEGCDRASRLVDQLLTLSRLDAADVPALAVVELGAVARRVVADLAPWAITRQQVLELDASATALVRGDEVLLGALLRNLVDNAVRYSPQGATVSLRIGVQQARVRLVVEDGGPGLGEADLTRLGERFFRVLGTQETGSGLGWSIVQRIARVHGAEVRVGRSDRLGGLQVTVVWPAAA